MFVGFILCVYWRAWTAVRVEQHHFTSTCQVGVDSTPQVEVLRWTPDSTPLHLSVCVTRFCSTGCWWFTFQGVLKARAFSAAVESGSVLMSVQQVNWAHVDMLVWAAMFPNGCWSVHFASRNSPVACSSIWHKQSSHALRTCSLLYSGQMQRASYLDPAPLPLGCSLVEWGLPAA